MPKRKEKAHTRSTITCLSFVWKVRPCARYIPGDIVSRNLIFSIDTALFSSLASNVVQQRAQVVIALHSRVINRRRRGLEEVSPISSICPYNTIPVITHKKKRWKGYQSSTAEMIKNNNNHCCENPKGRNHSKV